MIRSIRIEKTDDERKDRGIFFWSVRTFHGQVSVWLGLKSPLQSDTNP